MRANQTVSRYKRKFDCQGNKQKTPTNLHLSRRNKPPRAAISTLNFTKFDHICPLTHLFYIATLRSAITCNVFLVPPKILEEKNIKQIISRTINGGKKNQPYSI